MREGNEKERDCSVSRINTYRVGVQSEKNFFTQELGVDLDYVSRVFMVKQMEYHREMYSKLEQVYHQCWPSEEQPQGKTFFDMSCEYLEDHYSINFERKFGLVEYALSHYVFMSKSRRYKTIRKFLTRH